MFAYENIYLEFSKCRIFMPQSWGCFLADDSNASSFIHAEILKHIFKIKPNQGKDVKQRTCHSFICGEYFVKAETEIVFSF